MRAKRATHTFRYTLTEAVLILKKIQFLDFSS